MCTRGRSEFERERTGAMEVRGMRLAQFDELDSTSLHARRLLAAGEVRAEAGPVLFQATRQTGGVGRFGRAWASPVGGLWCTLLVPLERGRVDLLDGLGLRVGVACLRAVRSAMAGSGREAEVRLKWPNDVLIGGKKVLGVLSEGVPGRGALWVMIGVGVNANFGAGELPPGLRRAPTTLRDELGRDVDLNELRRELCDGLLGALASEDNAAALETARGALHGLGEPAWLRLPGGLEMSGTLVGLSDEGVPVLRGADGEVAAPPGSELMQDRSADERPPWAVRS
jgi:BirA family transcriptional regulator, biotin operon repressor / biotin---[acetyl-CoA-carboxylase] ligase